MAEMQFDPAARRYAEAVFGIARDAGTFDFWRRDLEAITDLARDGEISRVLSNDRVEESVKERLLKAALPGVDQLAMNLATLLVQRGRLALAPAIAQEYAHMLDQSRGIEHAVVTTAVPLSEAEQRAIAERLRETVGARTITLETRVDPTIIGGLVARIGDRLIDGSTRTRLLQLKRSLAEGAR